MKINNLPEYAKDCKYIVARIDGNDAWFWGAYEDSEKAYQSANEIKGILIVRNKEPFMNKACVSSEICEHDKIQVLDKVRKEIKDWQVDIHDNEYDADKHDFVFERIFEIIDEYKAER